MEAEIEYPEIKMRRETIYWRDRTTFEDDANGYQVQTARLSDGKYIYRHRERLRMPGAEVLGKWENGLPATRQQAQSFRYKNSRLCSAATCAADTDNEPDSESGRDAGGGGMKLSTSE
jgi:hypothetical protein